MTYQIEQQKTGIIIVDHGSRREESNAMLLDVVAMFKEHTDWPIVEPAHMELAEPSIAAAFDRCVERGASFIVVHPFFLLPGKHWKSDIPELARAAAAKHAGIRFLVTAPLGTHALMAQIMNDRIAHCIAAAKGAADPCYVCGDMGQCQFEEPATADSHPRNKDAHR